MSKELTHFDMEGQAIMVDVSNKKLTVREAVARGAIQMQPETLQQILAQRIKKGDVFAVARLAGIMAAKQTSALIPLCHPLPLSAVEIHFESDPEQGRVTITATTKVTGQTGIEMEALTAVSVAALTIYDMCKAVDKEMVIDGICLLKKTGGKSGTFTRSAAVPEIGNNI
ncbi:cyclic pyranopterin monophosphate synthase subunit MoaC [Desulfuromusa kysingii]|uniref:Cyclic pyranopterin monophosphate synthase n=1 Tax=Desulfuromusa kysingii TaxID=37625 RepID=A0A1H4CNJ6_9BACT|nr:cyclic pyranopterin monophosphate synthase MoaC [Desulfuromusa kysingii]SEA61632.1 cyclic pyranopterin monophosphate synthase subunit MoaC [Desulfuromusa kysingii]